MKIRIESPCSYKGDIYRFTWDFSAWLGAELTDLLKESDAFIEKYGKDWTLTFGWNTGQRIKKPKLSGPFVDRKYKAMRCVFELPFFRRTAPEATAYVPELKQFLKQIVAFLAHEQVDAAQIEKDTAVLLEQFVVRPGMLKHDPHPYTFGTPEDPYGLKREAAVAAKTVKPELEVKASTKFVKRKLPQWKIPRNIAKRVEAEDGMWEDERFDPILLTVMSGNSYQGREIPLTWQIEFDPYDDRLAAASEKIEASGIEPDGDGWAEFIEKKFATRYPKFAGQLHSDSETSTCVLWVKSEKDCKKLVGFVWSLIQTK